MEAWVKELGARAGSIVLREAALEHRHATKVAERRKKL
jgi:hypothetical protein